MKALVATVLVLAALSAAHERWASSPEAYFMTRDEQREWERITTDEEAARFIAAFRARRSATFLKEVEARAKVIDERIPLGETKASQTLRGRIIMLLGAPDELRAKPIPKSGGTSMGHPLESRKGGVSSGTPKASAFGSGAGWVEYTLVYKARPQYGIGPEGWTVVIEADGASGRDRLKYRRDKKRMEDILDAAARASFPAK